MNPLYILDKLARLNFFLVLLVITVGCIGFAMMFSAAEGNFDPWASSQITRFVALFPVMLLIAIIDIRFWYKISYLAYGATLVLLIIVEFMGVTAMGATRWINLGPFSLQPSEVMKVCLVMALARYFHGLHLEETERPSYLILPLLMILVPTALIMNQPDLGTALILLMIGGVIFFATGVKLWKFGAVLLLAITAAPIAWQFLHQYQKQRILTFINPEADPLGAGYNILQSKIAIGSGGFWGKGFLEGSQSQLSFLPEKQTDFIFTMFTEEFGFIGGVALIILYTIMLANIIITAIHSQSHFGRLLALGIGAVFFLHVFINIAMVMGLLPTVGVPLPLLSYGGTIMLTILIGFGLVLNVHIHRQDEFGRVVD